MITITPGRTLILTGASGGIGSEVARLFHAAGSFVVLVDRDHTALTNLAQELGERVAVVAGDASSQACAEQAVAAAVSRTGRIDDLVLAAGIYPESPVAEMTSEQWRQTIAINLDSAYLFTHAALGHMGPGGSIIGLTSIAGQRGSRNHAHYSATKAGLLAFLRSLALEVAPHVRVNAVAPGTIATPMTVESIEKSAESMLAATPLARFGTPYEVAAVIEFLASPAAGFITGEEISVNGGMYMN